MNSIIPHGLWVTVLAGLFHLALNLVALPVGDGEFARKSFDRSMDFKKAGKTILFCSHSLGQVEAICSRAPWLDRGQIRAQGAAAEVVRAYND